MEKLAQMIEQMADAPGLAVDLTKAELDSPPRMASGGRGAA